MPITHLIPPVRLPMTFYVHVEIPTSYSPPGTQAARHHPDATAFSSYVAAAYTSALKKAIKNQRTVSQWAPLSINYYKEKERKHLSLDVWEATGTLSNSIIVYTDGDSLLAGPNPHLTYPSGIKVLDVARILEFGSVSRHIPPRQLFRSVVPYITKRLPDLYQSFVKERDLEIQR